MITAATIVEGMVKADGTLEVPHKFKLPAGPVEVTVRPVPTATQPERFWKMMESIWQDLRACGRTCRTQEEIDAEIDGLRNEAEEEMQAVECLQEECRQTRMQTPGPQQQAD